MGAEKVRSKPGTGPRPGTWRRPSGRLVAGSTPVSIALSWSPSTLALEAEVLGAVAEPVALGLTLARVIVLGAFGDLGFVVALLAGAELPD